MLVIVRQLARMWWQTWPWLVAVYLLGWLLRYWVLQGAIAVGLAHGPVWGSLIVTFAAMVRLLTYLAMFLVIGSATPGLHHVETDGDAPRGELDIALSAVLPFLVIYTAWKLIVEDYFVFRTSAGYTAIFQGLRDQEQAFQLGGHSGLILAVIAAAFTARQLLTRFRDRLPRWTALLAVYAEVLWIFLVFQAGYAALVGTPRWLSGRRVVVWLTDVRDQAFAHLAVLEQLWNGLGAVLGALVPAVGLALAWLAIAGVVYGTPLTPTWAGARRALLGDRRAGPTVQRAGRTIDRGWQRVPGEIRSRAGEFAREQLGRFGPIVDSARLILHGGMVPIAFFVTVYTALVVLVPQGAYFDRTVTDGYLFRGLALLLGPHELGWWNSFADAIRIAIGAVVEPLRICLVAAAYLFCVDRVRAERSTGLEPDRHL